MIVVNKMTLSDQKNLKNILDLIPIKKKVFIIHNFFNLHFEKDIKKYILKDILNGVNSDKINEKDIDKSRKTKIYVQNDREIIHLVLANDYSEAGKLYNNPAFTFIKETIKNHTVLEKFDIKIKLLEFLNREKHKYLKNYEEIIYETKKNSKTDYSIIIKDNKKPLLLKPTLNYLGFVKMKEEVNINYCVRKFNKSGDLLIQIFLPGISKRFIESKNIKIEQKEVDEEYFCYKITIDIKVSNLNCTFKEEFDREEYFSFEKLPNKNSIEFLTCQLSYQNYSHNYENFDFSVENGIINIILKGLI